MSQATNEIEKDKLTVQVRMYCHGLGDCFLLTFKRDAKEFNMLIDCGVLQGTPEGKDKMRLVVEDVKEKTKVEEIKDETKVENAEKETKGKLDLVVVTHQHWDHISGFEQASDIFDDIDFKEVWLAWTEDPNNETANNLRQGFKARLTGLQNAINKLQGLGLNDEYAQINGLMRSFFGENFSDMEDESDNQLGAAAKNKKPAKGERVKAWDYILTKNKPNKPQYTYCYPGKDPLSLKGFEEDVRIYVFGPPLDPAKIRSLNPPSTEQYRHSFHLNSFSLEDSFFMSVDDTANEQQRNSCTPFDSRKQDIISYQEAQNENANQFTFFNEFYFSDEEEKNDWRRIDKDWLAMTGEFALKMDSYTNNTSLVLAIELIESGKVLLFVGDAQSGNWESWHDYEWEIKDENGLKQKVKAEDLLKRTVLYKVGHHGSHNATLKAHGLEMMTRIGDLVALIPTNSKLALSKKPHKWEMPFDVLLEDLQKKTNGRVIASDEGRVKKFLPPTADEGWNAFTEDEKKSLFGEKLFIDYLVE